MCSISAVPVRAFNRGWSYAYVVFALMQTKRYVYFGGKLIWEGQAAPVFSLNNANCDSSGNNCDWWTTMTMAGGAVFGDRLGSNRASGSRYYPCGEEIGTQTANDRKKFATYTRDPYTGLDYADQRYYASSYGRFNTVDPMAGSASAGNPGSWNRYAYVGGDPINHRDRHGLNEDDEGAGCVDNGDGCVFSVDVVGEAGGGGGGQMELDPCMVMFLMNPTANCDGVDSLSQRGGVGGNGARFDNVSDFLYGMRDQAKRILDGPMPIPCASDLSVVGVTMSQLDDKLSNLNIVNGVGNSTLVYTALLPGMDGYEIAKQNGYTIGQIMTPTSTTKTDAFSNANNNDVYIVAGQISTSNWSMGAGLVLHEILHKFGLEDGTLQGMLYPLDANQVGAASVNITTKLAADCFGSLPTKELCDSIGFLFLH